MSGECFSQPAAPPAPRHNTHLERPLAWPTAQTGVEPACAELNRCGVHQVVPSDPGVALASPLHQRGIQSPLRRSRLRATPRAGFSARTPARRLASHREGSADASLLRSRRRGPRCRYQDFSLASAPGRSSGASVEVSPPAGVSQRAATGAIRYDDRGDRGACAHVESCFRSRGRACRVRGDNERIWSETILPAHRTPHALLLTAESRGRRAVSRQFGKEWRSRRSRVPMGPVYASESEAEAAGARTCCGSGSTASPPAMIPSAADATATPATQRKEWAKTLRRRVAGTWWSESRVHTITDPADGARKIARMPIRSGPSSARWWPLSSNDPLRTRRGPLER